MVQEFINKQFYNLFVFTYIFGLVLYGTIGFDGIDEICAMLLLVLLIYGIFKTEGWYVNKAFLCVIGIFIFYACYSLYIHSNSKAAIVSDFIIQFKPYLAFFAVYYLQPTLSPSQRKILKDLTFVICILMLIIGCVSIPNIRFIHTAVGHVTFFAAIITANALLFLYLSKGEKKDYLLFILMLMPGLFSARSKFYGFFILSIIVVLFFKNIQKVKFNLNSLIIIGVCISAMIAASWQKLVLYFGVGQSFESIPKDFVARAMLYATSWEIFNDYFPFGSGFGSFATSTSGVYYSSIYEKYDINNIKGISKDNYSYIADAFYPSLAQFGVVGVILFFLFFLYLFRKAYTLYRQTKIEKNLIIPFLIICYLLIDNIADATFTGNRGLFILMFLGLILSEQKALANSLKRTK